MEHIMGRHVTQAEAKRNLQVGMVAVGAVLWVLISILVLVL